MTLIRLGANHRRVGAAVAGALAVGWLGLAAGPAWAANSTGDPNNIVQNSNFAAPAAPAGSYIDFAGGSASIPHWTVGGNSVDVCSGSGFKVPPGDPTGTQTVDLSGFAAGSISQDLSTTAGLTYTGSIELAANVNGPPEPKTGFLTVAGESIPFSIDGTGQTASTLTWTNLPFSFTATSSTTTVLIRSTTNSSGGPLVTDVIVDPPPTAGAPLVEQWIAAGAIGGAAVVASGFIVLHRRRRVVA